MKCSRANCENKAVYRPKLMLRACKGGGLVNAVVDLPVCDHCMIQSKAGDFMSDKSWAQIIEGFTKKGFTLPRRELTELTFVRL